MGIEILKVGDLVCCHHSFHVGIGYGKVLKIVNRETKQEYQEYGPIITGYGDKNSKLNVTVQYVGYDMTHHYNEDDLGEIVEVDEVRILDPHSIYRIVDEEMISKIRTEWERLMNSKLDFLYKHVNKTKLEGRKSLPGMKF